LPLARKAHTALIADHVEDVAMQPPMVSRILHLRVFDILAMGVAMRCGRDGGVVIRVGVGVGVGSMSGCGPWPPLPASA